MRALPGVHAAAFVADLPLNGSQDAQGFHIVGRPDPVWGEAVHAVIISAAGADAPPEEIISWSRERLAHFKCPKTVEFADSLPRTTTGKVLKRELRAQLAAAQREHDSTAGTR